jgi:hypothetical protein
VTAERVKETSLGAHFRYFLRRRASPPGLGPHGAVGARHRSGGGSGHQPVWLDGTVAARTDAALHITRPTRCAMRSRACIRPAMHELVPNLDSTCAGPTHVVQHTRSPRGERPGHRHAPTASSP